MITDNLKKMGYVFFENDGAKLSIEELGKQLGGIYQVPSMPLVQTLIPRLKENEPPNTYSGIFGVGIFPFHTDMAHWHKPPRYLVLKCSCPDDSVTTRLVQARSIIPNYDATIVKRSLFKPRRRLDRKMFFLRLAEPDLYRWDSVFIEPTNADALELRNDVLARLALTDFVEVRFTQRGQVLIIDNWRTFHSRSHVGKESRHRKLERIYLETVQL